MRYELLTVIELDGELRSQTLSELRERARLMALDATEGYALGHPFVTARYQSIHAARTGPDFDPATATTAQSAAEALALCAAWASGKRSWTNLVMRAGHNSGYDEGHSQQQTIAIMDAAETQKWAALAAAYAATEDTS